MKTLSNFLIYCVLFSFITIGSLIANTDETIQIPEIKHRITDLTNTLSETDRWNLENKVKQFQEETGIEIVTVIVPTVKPETIEQFSIRAAEKWKIGRKKIDDGVILLIALNDRKVRIEVGYGLEGVLPDIKCNQIIRHIITPYFKIHEYANGISNGIDAIIKVSKGENLPKPNKRNRLHSNGYNKYIVWMFVFIIISLFIQSIFGSKISFVLTVILGLIIGYFFLNLFIGLILSIFTSLLTQSGFSNSIFPIGMGGGGFGSSGNNYDHFSGGGGGFGGGGSSGDW